MNDSNAMRQNSNDNHPVRTVVVSMVGLLPVGLVSGMMLLQIFGILTY